MQMQEIDLIRNDRYFLCPLHDLSTFLLANGSAVLGVALVPSANVLEPNFPPRNSPHVLHPLGVSKVFMAVKLGIRNFAFVSVRILDMNILYLNSNVSIKCINIDNSL